MAEIDSTLPLSAEDIAAIDWRLQEVVHSCLAIHQLAIDAVDSSDTTIAERYMTAIKEMARSNVKGICACLDKLANTRMGNFETEFDRE